MSQPQALNIRPTAPTPVVFFVDDDDHLRRVTGRLLRGRGYDVVEAATAEQAFLVLDGFKADIDVLLMDINLPDGWGASVAQRLKETHPEMVVVYTTGFADVDPILSGGLNDAQYVVRKPFTTDQLVVVLSGRLAMCFTDLEKYGCISLKPLFGAMVIDKIQEVI